MHFIGVAIDNVQQALLISTAEFKAWL